MPDHVASRRTRGARGGSAVAVALVLVLAGFLFAANARMAGVTDTRHAQDLPSLVQVESQRTEQLASEVEALRAEIDALTDELTADEPDTTPESELVRLAAGRVPVVGPGLTVSLSDAPANAPRPDWVVSDQLVVHQQDLQAVINALWAGGAEAMTLQGERVISTSAFRCVGNVLLLHGRTYSPPYVVQAIGDPEELERALLRSEGVRTYLTYVDALDLGWSLDVEDEVELDAYQGPVELQYATVDDAAA
ncbi:DUF881 domain-containing protein [Cellulomonas carbonis]|uniref:DUF881 domain-containing protein n=1 Tax=Cellulomonas carbonis T26 TaxID=947969 RepID=A0A0A0BWJ9_9CELL|nr:DUF881 domain-containing protein [Cellulomonas carbonis]KGM12281.1 hypothetical protein N868_18075 [Cellulomonas carbonis T26]